MTRQPGPRPATELATEAAQLLRRLEESTRPDALGDRGAAECYEVLGQLRRIGEEINTTLSHLGTWLEQQYLAGRLDIAGDPFCTEPLEAVGRLLDGLHTAHESWATLSRSLQNAQVAAAGMVTVPPPRVE